MSVTLLPLPSLNGKLMSKAASEGAAQLSQTAKVLSVLALMRQFIFFIVLGIRGICDLKMIQFFWDVRSNSHCKSALFGAAIRPEGFWTRNGASRHLLVSAWPSAKEKPHEFPC